MSEHQNIEYKRIWQDSYLKWISGFANANGGTLFIEHAIHRPIEDVVEDVTKNVTKDVTKDVTKNVTENRIQQLLELIKGSNRISTHKLARILGVSRMTVVRDIEYLKDKGVLERIGPDKGGYWKIIK